MPRQHAPRLLTVAVALILVLIGVAGTFLGLLPSIAGVSGDLLGVTAYVLATLIMLLGVFARGL